MGSERSWVRVRIRSEWCLILPMAPEYIYWLVIMVEFSPPPLPLKLNTNMRLTYFFLEILSLQTSKCEVINFCSINPPNITRHDLQRRRRKKILRGWVIYIIARFGDLYNCKVWWFILLQGLVIYKNYVVWWKSSQPQIMSLNQNGALRFNQISSQPHPIYILFEFLSFF